jgi:hypothetical protein
MMSLEQASYVAQIAGGAAVVISLAYVGFQLRQNTVQLARGEANAALGQNSAFRLAIANNREVAHLWIQGLAGAPLEPHDRLRFDMLLSENLWISFHLWDRSRLGLGSEGQWSRGVVRGLVERLSTAGGSKWWARFKDRYPPAYVSEIDRELAATSPEGDLN